MKRPSENGKKNTPAAALDIALEASMVPAVSRAAAILRLLSKSSEPLGVQAIARTLGIIPSTCLHILRTLVAEELASVDEETKLYSLNAGILMLARSWLSQERFADIAQPVLDKVSKEFDVTAMGVQVIGLEHIVVVAMARAEGMLQMQTQIGSHFPALVSATGRCIAAFGNHQQSELQQRFKKLYWDNAPSLATWKSQVEETKANGYAVDKGYYMTGVTILAAPVFGAQGKMNNALVIVGISQQLQRNRILSMARALRESGLQISHQIGRRENNLQMP